MSNNNSKGKSKVTTSEKGTNIYNPDGSRISIYPEAQQKYRNHIKGFKVDFDKVKDADIIEGLQKYSESTGMSIPKLIKGIVIDYIRK